MVNIDYALLSQLTNEQLVAELLHRMANFSKYGLLGNKWNTVEIEDKHYSFKIDEVEL
jgi:hypothetical protein